MIIQTMPYPAGPAGLDPSIILQVQPSGADGSTTFTDESSYARTLTAQGNAQVDTAVTILGQPTALFDGTDDYINCGSGDDFDFGSGDFTIELFVKFNSLPTQSGLISRAAPTRDFHFLAFSTSNLFFDWWDTGGSSRSLNASGMAWNTTDTFHIAVSREAGQFRMFKNGVQVYASGAVYNGLAIRNGGGNVRLGEYNNSIGELNGHLGPVRIHKGTALYTANFTPPAAPFPT